MARLQPMHENMEIVFLGTGGSWPSVERNVAAVAVKRGAEILLFDVGEGTQRQFQRSRLSYMAVSKIFLTHLHGDHFLGLPGLVQTMRLNDRSEPLTLYGPPGTRDLAKQLLGAGRPRGLSFDFKVEELKSGDEVPFGDYRVIAREVKHNVYALGYCLAEDDRPGRFNKPRALELGVPEGRLFGKLQRGESVTLEDGRTITPDMVLGPARRGRRVAYTGDCVPCEGTVELARGADVLIHDSTYAADFQDANVHGHSTSVQAAFIASKAGVKSLYLTHISPRYSDTRPMLDEARKLFADTHVAHDFLEVIVRFPSDEDASSFLGTSEPDASRER